MRRSQILKKGLNVVFIVLFLLTVNVTLGSAQEVEYKKNTIYVTVPSQQQTQKLTKEKTSGLKTISLIDSIYFTGTPQ
jgi:Na+-transporting methylmalonyl-CoA/oxaloacetate decarboxylase gamma subunit